MAYPGGPAGQGPGTNLRGPIYVSPYQGRKLADVAVADEFGVLRASSVLNDNYYPLSAYPAASAGTPQTVQCQTLCRLLAKRVAQQSVCRSTAHRFAFRALIGSVTYGGGVFSPASAGPFNGVNLALSNILIASETVPVDVVLDNPSLIAALADRLGSTLAFGLDAELLAQYPSFISNPIQGTAGTALTDAVIRAAIAQIGATGEPIILCVSPRQYQASNFDTSGSGDSSSLLRDGAPWIDVASAPAVIAGGASPAPQPLGCTIVPSPAVPTTGSTPTTTHNFMFTPSAIGLVSGQMADVNEVLAAGTANAQVTASFQNLAISVFVNNTGAGNQTVYAAALFGVGALNTARGVQVNS
jgi:hypothetical protein